MTRNILKSSVDSVKFSIVFQILFRCITFILNAFIIRNVGQDVLGIMNVRLLLLESTLIFLSREPLLKACLTDTKSHNWAQVINQIWLSVPLSTILGLLLTYVWINLLNPTEDKYTIQYQWGCYAVFLSCMIDQITQCIILVAQSYCFVRLKVVFDTIYIIIRTTTFVVLVLKYPEQAINAFSVAQVISSLSFCLLFYGFFWWYICRLNKLKEEQKHFNKLTGIFSDMQDFKFNSICDFLPGYMENNESFLNKDLVILTVSFGGQSVVKQLLTEGERYVMTVSPVLTFSQQSMYDIVNNLGSLAARFIFRPIEESAYFYFSQMIKRDVLLSKQDKKNVEESATVLSLLLKIVTSIGLVVLVFGHNYSRSLLHLYGGNVLTQTELPTSLLKCHCFLVLLLSVNGITEGYISATMDNKQLNRYNYLLVIFSIIFLLMSYILTNILGPVGFIFANCINMVARIYYGTNFIKKQYSGLNLKPLGGIIPGTKFAAVLFVSGFFTKISEVYLYNRSLILHILFGGVCFLITALTWAMENKNVLKMGVETYKKRRLSKVD